MKGKIQRRNNEWKENLGNLKSNKAPYILSMLYHLIRSNVHHALRDKSMVREISQRPIFTTEDPKDSRIVYP